MDELDRPRRKRLLLQYPMLEERVQDGQLTKVAIPDGLRKAFYIHFLVDSAFAVPLMANPQKFLKRLGWGTVDPAASRLVAAALLATGFSSYEAAKQQNAEQFATLLNFKLVWSLAATAGLLVTASQASAKQKPALYGFAAVFGSFFSLWAYYRNQLFHPKQNSPAVNSAGLFAGPF